MSEKIKLGISMGDPNGVGIEIILKIFEDKRMFDFFSPIIFAPIELLERQKQFFNLTTNLFLVKDRKKYHNAKLNVFNIEMLDEELVFGRYSKAAGSLAFKSIKEASISALGVTFSGKLAFEVRRLIYASKLPDINESLKSASSWIFQKKSILKKFLKKDNFN